MRNATEHTYIYMQILFVPRLGIQTSRVNTAFAAIFT